MAFHYHRLEKSRRQTILREILRRFNRSHRYSPAAMHVAQNRALSWSAGKQVSVGTTMRPDRRWWWAVLVVLLTLNSKIYWCKKTGVGRTYWQAHPHIVRRGRTLKYHLTQKIVFTQVYENVEFEDLIEPCSGASRNNSPLGWRAKVSSLFHGSSSTKIERKWPMKPEHKEAHQILTLPGICFKVLPIDHPVSYFDFDVIIGADGRRNTLDGTYTGGNPFPRKEFRYLKVQEDEHTRWHLHQRNVFRWCSCYVTRLKYIKAAISYAPFRFCERLYYRDDEDDGWWILDDQTNLVFTPPHDKRFAMTGDSWL